MNHHHIHDNESNSIASSSTVSEVITKPVAKICPILCTSSTIDTEEKGSINFLNHTNNEETHVP